MSLNLWMLYDFLKMLFMNKKNDNGLFHYMY